MAFPASEEAQALGRQRSLAVRQANAAARQQTAAVTYAIVDEMGDVSPAALRAVLAIAQRVDEELATIEVDEALDLQRLANTAEILHRIHRLASGQSTSNTAHASLTDEERRERMARLRGDVPAE